jgi:hypothetical protein
VHQDKLHYRDNSVHQDKLHYRDNSVHQDKLHYRDNSVHQDKLHYRDSFNPCLNITSGYKQKDLSQFLHRTKTVLS